MKKLLLSLLLSFPLLTAGTLEAALDRGAGNHEYNQKEASLQVNTETSCYSLALFETEDERDERSRMEEGSFERSFESPCLQPLLARGFPFSPVKCLSRIRHTPPFNKTPPA